MSGGSIHLHRKVFRHPLFAGDPFSPREAWIWLVSEAAWAPHVRAVGSAQVSLARGQLAHSLRYLADCWQWSLGKVRRFLDKLTRADMATCEATQHYTLITIINYEDYQAPGDAENRHAERNGNRHTDGTPERHDVRHTRDAQKTAEISQTGAPDRATPAHPSTHTPARISAHPSAHPAAQNEKTTHEKSTHENPSLGVQREMPVLALVSEQTIADPVAEAVNRFNTYADRFDLPRCQKITDKRRTHLKARLNDCGGLDGWDAALAHIDRSAFLRGETGRASWRGCHIDFLCMPDRFTKLMEGAYDDSCKPRSADGAGGGRPSHDQRSAMARAVQRRMAQGNRGTGFPPR